MSSISPGFLLIFLVGSCLTKASPVATPLQLACRDLLKRSAECQITYTGWEQLTTCLKGHSVYLPDIAKTISCTCTASQPLAVTSAGVEYDPFTTSSSSPGPPIPSEQDDTFPSDSNVGTESRYLAGSFFKPAPPRKQDQININRPSERQEARGSNLADFDYVAPDGSVAMASRSRPPGVTTLAAIVLAVVVAVLLGVVTVLCCSRRHAGHAEAFEDEEYERDVVGMERVAEWVQRAEHGEGGEEEEEREERGEEEQHGKDDTRAVRQEEGEERKEQGEIKTNEGDFRSHEEAEIEEPKTHEENAEAEEDNDSSKTNSKQDDHIIHNAAGSEGYDPNQLTMPEPPVD